MGSKDRRNYSNIQCFLDATTPFVASQSLTKTSIKDPNSLWQPIGKETVDCFTLGDIWDQYYQWSAYGLGVPIHLPNGETVVQYYVPHLSAIQIYTSKPPLSRNVVEDSESDSWSDDSESEKLSKSWDAASEDSGFEQDGIWPAKDRIGQLYLQYVERCPPYGRIPLMEKINELAQNYPGLTSFKSAELSPASWMSISWYPIYHIPAKRNVKELSASFLTFHTISSSYQEQLPEDTGNDTKSAVIERNNRHKDINRISLPSFGLATYKMHGTFWMNPEMGDEERLVSLYSAADSWLKQLRVHHHDFHFFSTHSSM
ncbi:uncharacterized protein A4U43_C07F21430 [Asparagus officinalis]|uniref:DUF789 family protein n=1 Tax=Asparagus officinalis TaxID=4686 RepID=A0A5P1EDR3_ASPOF|nr:uncharacterized protein LOC109848995 [Asparagus officinalis]ONK64035.1 uncharacterized protein A4U43_C07F21430 [Asparagus officinalis]